MQMVPSGFYYASLALTPLGQGGGSYEYVYSEKECKSLDEAKTDLERLYNEWTSVEWNRQVSMGRIDFEHNELGEIVYTTKYAKLAA